MASWGTQVSPQPRAIPAAAIPHSPGGHSQPGLSYTSAKAPQTTHASKVWRTTWNPLSGLFSILYLFPSSCRRHVNPITESGARFLKEIQLPMNSSERWRHRTLNPKLNIINQLLDKTLQAMVDSSWNKNMWELDLVLQETASFHSGRYFSLGLKDVYLQANTENTKQQRKFNKWQGSSMCSAVSQNLKELLISIVVFTTGEFNYDPSNMSPSYLSLESQTVLWGPKQSKKIIYWPVYSSAKALQFRWNYIILVITS